MKHDLKILFSLFKKVSLVDDDNFLALFFLCIFHLFGALYLFTLHPLYVLWVCFLIQIFSVEKGDLLLFLISAPHY